MPDDKVVNSQVISYFNKSKQIQVYPPRDVILNHSKVLMWLGRERWSLGAPGNEMVPYPQPPPSATGWSWPQERVTPRSINQPHITVKERQEPKKRQGLGYASLELQMTHPWTTIHTHLRVHSLEIYMPKMYITIHSKAKLNSTLNW